MKPNPLWPEPHKVGSYAKFTYPDYGTPDGHPDHTAHSGQVVEVIRILGRHEIDEDAGPNYQVRATDGWIGTALHDELKPYKPVDRIKNQLIQAAFWAELAALKTKFPMVYIETWTPDDFAGDCHQANWQAKRHVTTAGHLAHDFDAEHGTNWDRIENAKQQ